MIFRLLTAEPLFRFKFCSKFIMSQQVKFYSNSVLKCKEKKIGKDNIARSVCEFYAKKAVFMTGGTGYLGKAMIEKLLRSCTKIDKIYILMREKKDISIEKRKEKLTEGALFERLKEENSNALKKIIHISGDMSKPGLGISESDRNLLIENVSVVFHMAATVRFDAPLETAVRINVEGTQGVLDLCHRMKKLQAFVHVSTAYSNTDKAIVEERVYPPPASLSEVYTFVKEHGGNELEEARFIKNRPNTYTFTKAIAEREVLMNHGEIPTAIVRPSMVTPILKEPVKGWVDNWYGPTSSILGVVRGFVRVMPANKNIVLDLVPLDIVVNMNIVAATRCQLTKDVLVYNCCSGLRRPVTIGWMLPRALKLSKEFNLNQLPHPTLAFTDSPVWFHLIRVLAETLPAFLLDLWLRVIGGNPKYVKGLRQYQKVVDTQKYFTTHDWVFHDDNVRELISTMSPEDQKIFYCDPAEIQWETYFADYLLGVFKYLLKGNK